jgi:NADP-dependent 3-hydroxy acid dehydrogenase YdfG
VGAHFLIYLPKFLLIKFQIISLSSKMAPAIPKDSLVLVTGVNGYIASHVADQLMEAGYRVRGTTRSLSKIEGLSTLWEKKFGKDRFEFVTVTDMSHDGAFDEAIKGKLFRT